MITENEESTNSCDAITPEELYTAAFKYLKVLEGSVSGRTKGALYITDALENLNPSSLPELLRLVKQLPEGRNTFGLIKAICTKVAQESPTILDSSDSLLQALVNIPEDFRPDIIAFLTSLPQQRQIWVTLKDLVNRISKDKRFSSLFENLLQLELKKPERLGRKKEQEQQIPETELRTILLGRLDQLLSTREVVSLYQQALNALDQEWITACQVAGKLQLGYRVERNRFSKDRQILIQADTTMQSLESAEEALSQTAYRLVNKVPFPYRVENNGISTEAPREVEKRARLTLAVMDRYNNLPEATDYNELLQTTILSLLVNREVQFILLACPVLKPEQFKGTEPWKYVSESAAGCNVLTNMPTTKRMFQEFTSFRIPARLVIVVGDDDEEAYIFTVTGTPKGIDPQLVEERRQAQTEDLKERVATIFPYRSRVEKWTAVDTALLPRFLPTAGHEIITLVEDITRIPTKYFAQEEVQAEMAMMGEIFGSYWYGYNLLGPDEITPDMLRQITCYKLAHYAKQGAKISLKYPFSILLQIELPSVLRTKMLNVVANNLNFLRPMPAIYPYAI